MVSLSRFLHETRRRKTIRTYLIKLRPLLAERYGAADNYSPNQVREAVQEDGLPQNEMRFAFAICCTPEAYAALVGSDYWAVRVDIGELFFSGNAGFTVQDAMRLIKTRREMVSIGGSGSDWSAGDWSGHGDGH